MNWVHIAEMPVGINDVDVLVDAAAEAVVEVVCASAEVAERVRSPAMVAVSLMVVMAGGGCDGDAMLSRLGFD